MCAESFVRWVKSEVRRLEKWVMRMREGEDGEGAGSESWLSWISDLVSRSERTCHRPSMSNTQESMTLSRQDFTLWSISWGGSDSDVRMLSRRERRISPAGLGVIMSAVSGFSDSILERICKPNC